MTTHPLRPLSLCAVLAALALSSCSDKSVVARAGKYELRVADLSAPGTRRADSPKRRAELLLQRAVLAEGARRAGLADDPAVRARVRASEREILAAAFLEKELANSTDEAALRRRYEEKKDSLRRRVIHVRQIVIRRPETPDADREALSRATEVYARLVGGADFAQLAREVSQDSVSAPKGGDVGPLYEGQVDSVFFSTAAVLSKGQYSKPFGTQSGYHLVQAIEDPQLVLPPFEELRGQLAAVARTDAEAALLARLRSEIPTEIFEDRLPPPDATSRADERNPQELP